MKSRLIIGLAACVMAGGFTASAFDFESNGLYYNILNANQVEVTCKEQVTVAEDDGAPESVVLEIPAMVSHDGTDYSVVAVGDAAFLYDTTITECVLPATVARIGFRAFASCRNLSEINLPGQLISIGEGAFTNTALTSVEIPAGVTDIGATAFASCRSLTEVGFDEDNRLRVLPEGCFLSCASLEEIKLPWTLGSMGKSCFAYCESLKEIDLSSVDEIGAESFDGCVSLERVEFKGKTIGERAFNGCRSLSEVRSGAEFIGKDAFLGSALRILYLTDDRNVCSGLAENLDTQTRGGGFVVVVPEELREAYKDKYTALADGMVALTFKSDLAAVEDFFISLLETGERKFFYDIKPGVTVFTKPDTKLTFGWEVLDGLVYEILFDNRIIDNSTIAELDDAGKGVGMRYTTPALAASSTLFIGHKGAGVAETDVVSSDRFDVYTVAGHRLGADMNSRDLELLPRGIYILRSADGTRRIMR